MNKTTVFVVTGQGRALLEIPHGRITGDARLVMGLIDGRASIAEIAEKIPPSVRIHLTGIFERLLNYGAIEERDSAGSGVLPEEPVEFAEVVRPPAFAARAVDERAPIGAGIEDMRRLELERELQEVRSKLDATIARQKKVEGDCLSLVHQASAHAHGTKEDAADATRAHPAYENAAGRLHVSPETINQLNQALLEQQEILGSTLRLRAYQAQLAARRHRRETEHGGASEAPLHPYYKSLRGLDFFRGFSNKELIDFLDFAKWQEAKGGDALLSEGEIGMSFYVIISGTVNVFRKDNLLASLGRGDFFGEFAYLSGEAPVRSARVVATSNCELLAIDPLDIEFAPLQLRLRVVEALLRGQVRRALRSDQRIENLSKNLE